MNIREFLQRISEKRRENKEELARMIRMKRQERISDERLKSPNERELNRFLEEERQKRIKSRLETFRDKQQKGWWKGQNILNQKNIFKEDVENQILKQKNIFAGHNSKNKIIGGSVYFR